MSPLDALAATVKLNTSSLANVSGRLDFVLYDGDGVANNSVTISNIAGNGTFLGRDCSVGCTGGASSFVIDDGLGFGELLYDLTFGTSLSFDLSYTTRYAGTGDPDRFSFGLLGSDNFSLIDTNLASDALFTIDLVGSGVVQRAGAVDPVVGLAIPEPGSLALATAGLLALVRRRTLAAFRASTFG